MKGFRSMELERLKTRNLRLKCLNDNCATTRLCYKLIDDEYLDKNRRIKEDLKFKINIPKFKIQNSKIIGKPNDKFETCLFLPPGEERKGEGGLRTKGYFKFSYRKGTRGKGERASDEAKRWWIVDENDNFIKKVNLPEAILRQLSTNDHELTQLPLITVITVVLNGAKYLEETIQSVINQTYPNVEYIIIDGGSTDGTLDIIKKYEDKIDYWVSEKDSGIYNAMNKGLLVALGKYIGILNSDDCYTRKAIEKSVEKLLESKSDYSIGNTKILKKGTIRPIIPLKKKTYQEMPYPHVSALISMKVYKYIGFFDETLRIAGDHDMAVRIIKEDFRYCYVDDTLAILKEGGISSGIHSNFESYKVAIKNGKPISIATKDLLIQSIKYILIKVTPSKIIKYIQRLKGSRFVD